MLSLWISLTIRQTHTCHIRTHAYTHNTCLVNSHTLSHTYIHTHLFMETHTTPVPACKEGFYLADIVCWSTGIFCLGRSTAIVASCVDNHPRGSDIPPWKPPILSLAALTHNWGWAPTVSGNTSASRRRAL